MSDILRFVYCTDLHGDTSRYDRVFDYAVGEGVSLIHLGADLLPKGSHILSEQKKFVKGYFKEFYRRCSESGIKVIAFWGNDDVYTRKKYFKEYGTLLDEVPYEVSGYTFKAYPYVPDYPFGLKSACKRDHSSFDVRDQYISRPIDVGDDGFVDIPNVNQYFKDKGTIEEDLRVFKADSKTIVSFHCPPCGLSLDVCSNGKRVGSKAIYDWIVSNEPPLVLCGHIHESYQITGVWKTKIGKSWIIQPGQNGSNTTAVLIEVGDDIHSSIYRS